MLVAKSSADVAPMVNLRIPLRTDDEAHKQGIHPGFETQGRCHQKSKTGVLVALQKRIDVLKNFFLKKSLAKLTKSKRVQACLTPL